MEQLLFKNVRAIVTCDPTDQVFMILIYWWKDLQSRKLVKI